MSRKWSSSSGGPLFNDAPDTYYGPRNRQRTLSVLLPRPRTPQRFMFDTESSPVISDSEDSASSSDNEDSESNASIERSHSTSSLVRSIELSRANTQSEYTGLDPGQAVRRRASVDVSSSGLSKRFFIADINQTLDDLLRNEDTDHNCQITIEDTGPKVLKLGTANSAGYNQYAIRGTYMLSNLLQELTIAKLFGRKQMLLDEARLNENPVDRLIRIISFYFWKNLTRQVTEDTILDMALDTKIDTPEAKLPRVYVPHGEDEQFYYYSQIAKRHPDYKLQIEYLLKDITSEYVLSINHKPGLLALAVKHKSSAYGDLEGYPYIVPGGRFNEQYGWDSYFEMLGLLRSGILDPCIGMCENFIFEIEHYGKILNANRSYYLGRSQPPFLTDMALKIYQYCDEVNSLDQINGVDFLKRSYLAAIKEYNQVWTSEPRLDKKSGLSCYHPSGLGIPPETEFTHFQNVLKPYCEKYSLSFEEFQKKYNSGEIHEPDLEEYFLHDRAVRESGHDTSYRLEGICANLATIDLNCLLYRYETDIAFVIKKYFNDNLNGESSQKWLKLAETRLENINKYCWNESESLYYDYNVKTGQQSTYESVTSFYALWAGVCTPDRAKQMVENSLSKFEVFGGLTSGSKASLGNVGIDRPSRQWDYPFAWAPHQMLTWEGLLNPNPHSPQEKVTFPDIARRLAYRWCYLITLAFVDFNGIVVEKYDATSSTQPHKVEAEYGNQGSGFKGVATEGFGWVNASYVVGVGLLSVRERRALGLVSDPKLVFK